MKRNVLKVKLETTSKPNPPDAIAALDAAYTAWLNFGGFQPEVVVRTGNPCYQAAREEGRQIIAAIELYTPIVAALCEKQNPPIDSTGLLEFLHAGDSRSVDGARAARTVIGRLRARQELETSPVPSQEKASSPLPSKRLNPTDSAILKTLQHGPLQGYAIARKIGRDYDYVRQRLGQLIKTGKLKKHENGYELM